MRRSLSAAGVALAVLVGSSYTGPIGLAQDPKPAPTPAPTEPSKPDDKKPSEPSKPDDKKPGEPSKPDDKKPEDKKPGEPTKPEDKKPGEPSKPDDKKPGEPSKPEDKKPGDTPKAPEKKAEEKKAEAPSPPARRTPPKPSKIKPYDEIVTPEFKSDNGLFFVHKSDDRILYEIPTDALGKDMVWVRSIEKTGSGSGYNGTPLPERVVRWEQRGDDILLRDVKYDIRAETKDPIHDAVEAHSVFPIISVLGIRAYGKDKAPVVDVTELFTSDMPEFSASSALGGAGADPRKTFIEGVKSFPENIETKVLMTFRRGAGGGLRMGPTGPIFGGGGGGGSVTALIHHSMVKLPEEPMKPRKFDERIGYFTEDFEDYGDIKNHQVENVKYITRWRLEKKDPSADLSEPKKQIVYYIGREVPEKFKPFIKKGVEAWQPAFEKAGFKNAIVAKEAPSARDEEWDAEDARYSTIRWYPSTTENAMGPNVHDPRTGEILESDIIMWHNILKLARDWYFVQASPNDPKAQQLPLPDDLIGELITYVTAHEVGHTLGLRHNMKASSSFTVAQLRDPKFTAENGTEASIMDYGRFNYVAQPGDGAALIPKIGPYDRFAIEWGYKPFPGANTYEQEKAKLEEIVSRQIKDPTVRFGGGGEDGAINDPTERSEDLGDDAIAATDLGLKNIDRVAGYLVKATSKKGEDYEQLRNMYDQLVGQRTRELGHVTGLVGGSVKTNIFFGDADSRFSPVPGDQQKKAIGFLLANAFTTPKALIAADIVARLEPNGAADRILNGQRSLLRTLLNEGRIKRMAEQVTEKPAGSYAPIDMLADLRNGLFGDLKAETPELDLYRRNLQRAYAEALIAEVNKDSATSDLPALARGELRAILGEIDACKDKKVSPTTRAYLDDMRARIAQALEPKAFVQPSGGSNVPRIIFGGDADEPGPMD